MFLRCRGCWKIMTLQKKAMESFEALWVCELKSLLYKPPLTNLLRSFMHDALSYTDCLNQMEALSSPFLVSPNLWNSSSSIEDLSWKLTDRENLKEKLCVQKKPEAQIHNLWRDIFSCNVKRRKKDDIIFFSAEFMRSRRKFRIVLCKWICETKKKEKLLWAQFMIIWKRSGQ
jgi:hypothetical protein